MTGPRPLRPCGTRAAYQRHKRNGETPCAACRKAESWAERDRRNRDIARPARERETLDPIVPYRWRAERYPWAVRVLAAAEAEWGSPDEESAA